jgi:hypothetical protein
MKLFSGPEKTVTDERVVNALFLSVKAIEVFIRHGLCLAVWEF